LTLCALAACSSLVRGGLASPAVRRDASRSIQDKVVEHLQSNNKVTWQPAGNGHYVDIPEDTYNKALDAVGESKSNKDRRGAPNDGTVAGYAVTNAVCYNRGALATGNDITQFAVSACDGLVNNALPPLAANVLRIWQSATQNDVQGLAAYIRFGVKILQPNSISNPSLCQAAVDAFNNYCQNGNGNSQGGELDVGGVVRFSADPTEVATNY